MCFAKETNRGFDCVRSSFSKEIAFRFKNMHRGWCGQGVARIKFYATALGQKRKEGQPAWLTCHEEGTEIERNYLEETNRDKVI